MPARTSSQKWLPVAMTENQTQAGQSAQTILANQFLHTAARTTPTIRASAACRLGIAAYGFATKLTRPLPWLRLPHRQSVLPKPRPGDNRGGADSTSSSA